VTAIVADAGSLSVVASQDGELSVGISLDGDTDDDEGAPPAFSVGVEAEQEIPLVLPGPGCFVVTVDWETDVGDGLFTALAESESGMCGVG